MSAFWGWEFGGECEGDCKRDCNCDCERSTAEKDGLPLQSPEADQAEMSEVGGAIMHLLLNE